MGLITQKLGRKTLQMFLSLCVLLLSLYISWLSHWPVNYGYSFYYDLIAIDKTIAQYAPQNRYRSNFELLEKKEHLQLFSEIAHAVHFSPKNLKSISYTTNGMPQLLLHEAEVTHLKDVNILMVKLHFAAAIFVALLIVTIIIINLSSLQRGVQLKNTTSPPMRKPLLAYKEQFISLFSLLAIATTGLFLAGPKNVFYWLHIQVFPDGHQWFFYYQESLMSTMMQAPNLFAAIAASLLVLAIPIYCLFIFTINRFVFK